MSRSAEAKWTEANRLFKTGQLPQAAILLNELLEDDAYRCEAAQMSAIISARQRDFERASALIALGLAARPDHPSLLLTAANIAQDLGDTVKAETLLRRAVSVKPDFAEAHNNLGILCADADRHEEAEQAFEAAVLHKPNYVRALTNLAALRLRRHELDAAEAAISNALALDASAFAALTIKGQLLFARGRYAEAEATWKSVIARTNAHEEASVLLSSLLARQRRFDEQFALVNRSLSLWPGRLAHWVSLMDLAAIGDDRDTLETAYQKAIKLDPTQTSVRAKRALYLPNVPQSAEEVESSRTTFVEGLDRLAAELSNTAMLPKSIHNAMPSNFLLAYQGKDDRLCQRQYSEIVCNVLKTRAPQFFVKRASIRAPRKRIRVGFASRFFYESTVGHYFSSWVTDLPSERFEKFVYTTTLVEDELTERIRSGCDHFLMRNASLSEFAELIAADRLDVLIYPEIGMEQQFYLLSAMRLAPLQLCAWGHPVTPGHQNIDGYISCELMEPENAQRHYNEPLHLLPGIGVKYRSPGAVDSDRSLTRSDFQLPENKTIILFPQSLFKIHPDVDECLLSILAKLEDAVLVIFAGLNQTMTRRFVERLRACFERAGLRPDGRVRIMPAMRHADYRQLNRLSDFMLDSFYWSGGQTTIDALSCGLPVVTLPGEFMRGRQSMAMLKMIGIPELIAKDKDDYAEIAVRLGLDTAWRTSCRERVLVSNHKLFDDDKPVVVLADLLLSLTSATEQPTTAAIHQPR
jgi:CRISPR-associated protein Csy1